ncbi:hypothetical protein [Larkinella rosea]|uniref:Uncharacterized protein n=1 Tax=Larkinella rosea TaxID=2025312 RepID=A0A3P1C0R5_9BACT|nr:hypothetical protein [Larkinella rosea]RRB06852.1 hypothetical protein EHT25_03425 [Larkinella rosea]
MNPNSTGQLVKFPTPYPDENPNHLYVVLEIFEDERPRAHIQALNTGLSFPSVNTVRVSDLDAVKMDTNDLLGHKVTIRTSDFSKVTGKVVQVSDSRILLDMIKHESGVETNVRLTVKDNEGIELTGTLFEG